MTVENRHATPQHPAGEPAGPDAADGTDDMDGDVQRMPAIRLAILGLGRMGTGMAQRLLDAGFPLTVWNRTAASARPLVAAGAASSASPATAVAAVDTALLSLSDAASVESVLFGADGAASALRPGALVVNTTTVSPEFALTVAGRLAERAVRYLDVAVLGNPFQIREGQVRILAAGAREDLSEARPLLDALGKQVTQLGAVGLAASTKLVFNALLGAQLAALAEAVGYGVSAGLDLNALLGAIAESGFSSKVMAFRAGLVQQRRYRPPAFSTALMSKDMGLVLAEGARHGVQMPLLRAAGEHFREAIDGGDGDLDAAVVIERRARRTPTPSGVDV